MNLKLDVVAHNQALLDGRQNRNTVFLFIPSSHARLRTRWCLSFLANYAKRGSIAQCQAATMLGHAFLIQERVSTSTLTVSNRSFLDESTISIHKISLDLSYSIPPKASFTMSINTGRLPLDCDFPNRALVPTFPTLSGTLKGLLIFEFSF